MVELNARTPLDGVAPIETGTVSLREVDLGHLSSVSPFKGQDKTLSDLLKEHHGMAAPTPGRATGKEGARAIWFGHQAMLLAGPAPAEALLDVAAVTDQSDAWTAVRLEGSDAAQVLARLTPIDLRPDVFKRGHTARTDLQHMMASITRISENSFLILVFRSMAETLWHDLSQAIEGIEMRGRV